jgi:ketosteroid isomerase-like protein
VKQRIEKNRIIAEIKQAAINHLNAKSSEESISHFTKDIVAVSNEMLFSTYDALEKDVRDYYKILKKINYAKWDDVKILVINNDAATFTAKFNYSFTSVDDEVTNLNGIWTALFVRESGNWKIRLRHETFTE